MSPELTWLLLVTLAALSTWRPAFSLGAWRALAPAWSQHSWWVFAGWSATSLLCLGSAYLFPSSGPLLIPFAFLLQMAPLFLDTASAPPSVVQATTPVVSARVPVKKAILGAGLRQLDSRYSLGKEGEWSELEAYLPTPVAQALIATIESHKVQQQDLGIKNYELVRDLDLSREEVQRLTQERQKTQNEFTSLTAEINHLRSQRHKTSERPLNQMSAPELDKWISATRTEMAMAEKLRQQKMSEKIQETPLFSSKPNPAP